MRNGTQMANRKSGAQSWLHKIFIFSLWLLVSMSLVAVSPQLQRNMGAAYLSHALFASHAAEADALVFNAAAVLQTKQSTTANDPAVVRLQSRALQMSGNYTAAISRLRDFLSYAPADVGDREVRHALAGVNRTQLKRLSAATDRQQAARALYVPPLDGGVEMMELATLLQNRGQTIGVYSSLAEHYLAIGQYTEAVNLFQLAQFLSTSPDPAFDFQASIAAVLADKQFPLLPTNENTAIYDVTDGGNIEGEHLQWQHHDSTFHVSPGAQLSDFPSHDSSIGTLWWEQPAAAIIKTARSGCYDVTVRARQVGSESGVLQFTLDRTLIGDLSLTSGWNSDALQVCLTSGFFVVQVAADDSAGDVEIDWVRFERRPE